MPLYDFRSPCGRTFDRLAKPEDTPQCPCGTPGCTGKRLPGTPAFALKGAGWTDKGRRVSGSTSST